MKLIRRFVITNNLGSFGDVTTRAAVLENNVQSYSVFYYTKIKAQNILLCSLDKVINLCMG